MDAMIIVNEAKDSILKRGVILCKLDIEKVYDHAESSFLLAVMDKMGFGGEVAKVVLSSFGVVWVFPNSVRNLLLEWKIKGLGKKRSVVWKMAPICLFWCIWGERNRRMFQEEEKSNTSLKNLFLRSLLEWSQQFMGVDYLSFMNVLDV